MSNAACRELRVEYLDRPIAVATRTPRFSWLAGHRQIAYRVEVHDGRSVLWDSGRVESADTHLIEYAGERLRSNGVYRWTVTSWDSAGAIAVAHSDFGVGLLEASDWRARWVTPAQLATVTERMTLHDWITGHGPSSPVVDRLRPVQLVRQSVELDALPVRARLYATAHGVYELQVNGQRAGDEVLAPGADSYVHRLSVQCYDVTGLLAPGENVIGMAVADGWWAGRIGISGSSAQYGDTTGIIWQLHVEHADGTSEVVSSDPDAAASRPGPWTYADLFIGERFDARENDPDWARPGTDDSAWQRTDDGGADASTLVPFAGEPVRRVAILPGVSATSTDEGWIIDFGQVIAGRVRLRLRGTRPGQPIRIEHTEVLQPDGTWFQNILGANKEQTDIYIAAGGAVEVFEPTFTFHGFRYARIHGVDHLDPADVEAVVLSSDLPRTGSFHSSAERLNRLHENVVWSQRANFLSIPTDCPQRERAGWTGDIQVFAPAAANNALVAPFLARWLDNLRADQLPGGEIPIISPRSPFDIADAADAEGLGAIVSAAGWSDAIAFVPWTLYERYGDVRVLRDNYVAVTKWIEHQRRVAALELPDRLDGVALAPEVRARQGLLYNSGLHFGDWLTPSTLVGASDPFAAIMTAPTLTGEVIAPMFQAQTLTLAARMADVLGYDDDAADFTERAKQIRDAFAAEYVGADGNLPHPLQGLHVLALAFDMVPGALRATVAGRLADLVRKAGDKLDTGFLSMPYLLDVLWDNGYPELARRVLWQSEAPSWLSEVDRGATTIWESWDAVGEDGTPRPVSMNHYAFGCVDDWLYRRLAGIVSTSPGYRTVTISPDLDCGLDHVVGSIRTPQGELAVHWTRDADRATVRVTVPHGVDATLQVGELVASLEPGVNEHDIPITVRADDLPAAGGLSRFAMLRIDGAPYPPIRPRV